MWWRRRRSSRRRDPDDLAEEIRAHLDLEEAQLRDEGLSAEEAHRQARRRFGNPTIPLERAYEMGRWRWLDTLRLDVGYALRLMRRSPAFTATAVLVLGLGIGVNTALFSVVNALFFRPPQVHDPASVRFIRGHMIERDLGYILSSEVVEAVAGLDDLIATVAVGGYSSPRKVRMAGNTSFRMTEPVTASYFDLVDTSPLLGRALLPDDNERDAPAVVVISERLWRSVYDGSPDVLGARFEFDMARYGGYFGPWRTHRIVGVLPADFRGLGNPWKPTDVWLPSRRYAGDPTRGTDDPGGVTLLAALRPGVSDRQVDAALEAVSYRFQSRPETPTWTMAASTRADVRLPFTRRVASSQLAAGLMVISGLVLLIAASNLIGVLGARCSTRRAEISVRLALGAARGRVFRQLLTESLMLSVLGSVLAMVSAPALIGAVLAGMPSQFGPSVAAASSVSLDVPLDARVLAFTALLAVGVGMAIGLLPARRALRVDVVAGLTAGVATERPSSRRGRFWVVVPQLAGSLVLLLVAGTLVQTLLRAQAHAPGYDPDQVAMVSVEAPFDLAEAADRQARLLGLQEGLLERARAIPGVESASIVEAPAGQLPLRLFHGWVVPRDAFRDDSHQWMAQGQVTSGFFDTLRIPLRAGRFFDERDAPGRPPVAIVSETAARLLWPGQSAVGHYLARHFPDSTYPPVWLEVVGVVGDAAAPENEGWNPAVYTVRGQGQMAAGGGMLLVRGSGPTGDLVRQVTDIVEAEDPTVQLMAPGTLRDALDAAVYPRRMAAGILSWSGAFGLLLAVVGLYGVIAFSATQRVRELGIRAALGASRPHIVWLVLGDGVRVLVSGLLFGSALMYAATRAAAALVLPLPAIEGSVIALVTTVFVVVTLAACVVPAWRASHVDPTVALREL